jgi:tRNA(fMet)-specific endonuclease VapC
MGLILDSSVLIAGERRGETVKQVIDRVRTARGDEESALSAVSIIELTHGIYRAKTDADRQRRRAFVEELCRDMIVHPLTLAIAQLAGRIEGEQAVKGISIAVEDLVMGPRLCIWASMSPP